VSAEGNDELKVFDLRMHVHSYDAREYAIVEERRRATIAGSVWGASFRRPARRAWQRVRGGSTAEYPGVLSAWAVPGWPDREPTRPVVATLVRASYRPRPFLRHPSMV